MTLRKPPICDVIKPPELTWVAWRYSVVRLWTCPISGIPHWFPLLGGRTVPEISAMAGIVTVLLGIGIPQYGGQLESFMSIISFILVFFILRSNYLLRAIGVSYERGIVFHKITGLLLSAVVIVHAVRKGLNASGYVLSIAILFAAIVYLFEYLWGKFDIFYYGHIIGALTIVPAAFVHGRPYIAIAKFLWVTDVIIRNFIRGRKVKAKVRVIGGNNSHNNRQSEVEEGQKEGNDEKKKKEEKADIICLEFPITPSISASTMIKRDIERSNEDVRRSSSIIPSIGGLNLIYGRDRGEENYFPSYQPGQYCFLMIPEINKVEYHPFTIASASFNHPNREDYAVFYIKRSGDWTNALVDIVEKRKKSGNTEELLVHVEGPYGILSVEMFNTEVYRTVVLISGGVGVTPMISLLSAMMRERINNKASILEEKEQRIHQENDDEQDKPEEQEIDDNNKDNIALSPENSSVIIQQPRDIDAFCQGNEFKHPRRTVFFYWVARDKALIEEVIDRVFTPLFTELDFSLLTNDDDRRVWRCTSTSISPSVVEEVQLIIHYSNKSGTKVVDDKDGNLESFVAPALKRMPIPLFFDELQKRERSIRQWRLLDERRVAVAVCGPAAMVAEVRAICDCSITCFMQGYDPEHVRFDCHEEIFRF